MMVELIKFTDNDANYELMYKWCSKKCIYEWFEQRVLSIDEIKIKYKGKLLDKKQDLFFISYDGVKIGFVQIYESDKNIYEYDIFIGEEEYLSRGIGTIAVKYINKYIYDNYLADSIILRPFKRNIRAIKCYEKSGFNKTREYDDVDTIGNKEKYVVMINNRGSD